MVDFMRRGRTAAFYLLTFILVTAGAIWLALRVTPLQDVSAAGQTARVGATLPNASLRGPGELDLFGQVVPTRPWFTGPIRPRLELRHISIDPKVVQMLRSDGSRHVKLSLSQQLAAGWERYFLWETLIAMGFAAIPLIAIAALRRRPAVWKLVAGGAAVVCVVNVGGILLTAAGTPRTLRGVRTLDDLAGVTSLSAPPPAGRPQPGAQAVVIGDSTASGWGLPWVANPAPLDKACGRSADAFAGDLAAANNWNVINDSCGGATIKNGLLGPQVLYDGEVAPPQLPEAAAATHAKVVIVSVGADDLQWSVMTRLCAAAKVCNDKVSSAYFSQLLGSFTRGYYETAQRPGPPAAASRGASEPVLLAVRLVDRLPGPVRHDAGQGEGASFPAGGAEHGAVRGGGRVRLRRRGSPVHRARAVHPGLLRAGALRPRPDASRRRGRTGHRAGRRAGAARPQPGRSYADSVAIAASKVGPRVVC
ncbi:MAG: GDSL-type esterase/lipase family protein [Streptosporangiales bacterium]|nr:GDSL-type esterase/lipase family protein [Streptosporangiales bacterium]